MKKFTITEFNPCRCFRSQEDARNWLLKNIYRLEDLINIEIKEPEYLDDVPEFIRPDIYGKIRNSRDLLVVSINLDKKITNDDLKKFLDTVAFNDASLAVWVLTEIDERLQCMLEWISQKMEPKVEFLILKLSAFEIEKSGPALSLDRM